MGDYTWHTSDPDHSLIVMGGGTHTAPAPMDQPIYLLAPDGRKWRESDYDGYGVFDEVHTKELMDELNSAAEEEAHPDLHKFRRRSLVDMELLPYGDVNHPTPVGFPLKFTRNPDATYEELPASIPATPEVKYLKLADFDIHLPDGTVVLGENAMSDYWPERAVEMGLLSTEQAGPDMVADWLTSIFYDHPATFTVRDGEKMVYSGYKKSVHDQMHEMVLPVSEVVSHTAHIIRNRLTPEEIHPLVEIFDFAANLGAEAYEAEAQRQIALYEAGQPLEVKPLFSEPAPDVYFMIEKAKRENTNVNLDEVALMGKIAGAKASCRKLMDQSPDATPENPFRMALNES